MGTATVVVGGAPGIAQALEASGQFARVVDVESTDELRDLLSSRKVSGSKDSLVFLFADTIRQPTLSLSMIVQLLTSQAWKVGIIAVTGGAATLVAQHPAAGLLEGPFTTNSVLAACLGLGLRDLKATSDGNETLSPTSPRVVPVDAFSTPTPLSPTPVVTPPAPEAPHSPWPETRPEPPPAPSPAPSTVFAPPAPPTPPAPEPPAFAPPAAPSPPPPTAFAPPAQPAQPAPPAPATATAWPAAPTPAPAPAPEPTPPPRRTLAPPLAPPPPPRPATPPVAPPPPTPAPPAAETPPTVAPPAQPSPAPPTFGRPAPVSWDRPAPPPSEWSTPAPTPVVAPITPVPRVGAAPVVQTPRRGMAILVTVPKGGTGKSSLALNATALLGLRLRAVGRTVCIIDANSQQADTGKYLKAYAPDITALAKDQSLLTVENIQKALVHVEGYNFSALLGPQVLAEASPFYINAALYTRALDLLRHHFDYIIIDSPVAELHHPMFLEFALPQANFIMVTITPNVITAYNTESWLQEIIKPAYAGGAGIDPQLIGIVLNRFEEGIEFTEEQVRAQLASWHYLGSIPERKEWKAASNLGDLVVTDSIPEINDPFARILYQITGEVTLMDGLRRVQPVKPSGLAKLKAALGF